ncbi:HEAT repeat domain-containing protein [Clostridium sp.]|uniref:HEAT repeat domain-containing protein n=1 Tax=Clostridium sp. TaxID=1506 RepID=UPI001A3B360C|nr:HEAT repeat domain-containing protein [Clostridium sp.]MBK5241554.1 HEAT repeat domain-containing protein [Clostridium sp.]
MFSNNIKSFIILNIYVLIIVDIVLLLAIYYEITVDKIKNYKYEKAMNLLKPKVLAYIENEDKLQEVGKSLKSNFYRNVVIDIMVDYSEENNVDISEKFIVLKLDAILIKKIQRKVSIVYVRKLAFMRVETAYNTLIELAESEDLDISYISFFGLSLIKLPEGKTEIAIKKLVVSRIISDRIIEILSRYNLKFEEWLNLLEEEETIEGKAVFIKNIMVKEEIKNEINSDRLLKFLKDESEVKIAAIIALCTSKNEKYINELISTYENEEKWQVRVAVARGLSNFKIERVKDTLLKMTKDSEWWVRYNAVKSIVAMGEEGLFTLIDLSLEKEDKKVSDLAYYFLNSNKHVYNIVKNLEV